MKNLNKVSRKQLEKLSVVFVQLGLVLTLFIVYALLEHKTVKDNTISCFIPEVNTIVCLADDFQNKIIQKEVRVKSKPVVSKRINFDEIKVGEEKLIEVLFTDESIDIDPLILDENTIVEIDEPEMDEAELISYVSIESAPIFKGCEGLSKSENRKCFEKSIARFFIKNFDGNLAQELGLSSGKHKIYSEIVINKNGVVDILNVRSPHINLTKEAKRVIRKLPKFIPGMQRKCPVKVKYILPISFLVQ